MDALGSVSVRAFFYYVPRETFIFQNILKQSCVYYFQTFSQWNPNTRRIRNVHGLDFNFCAVVSEIITNNIISNTNPDSFPDKIHI